MRHDSTENSRPYWHWHRISRQDEAILKTLEIREKNSQQILQTLRKVLEIELKADSIYSVLRKLASRGLIETRQASKGKAKIHSLTDLGKEALLNRAKQWEQLAIEGNDFEQNIQT